MTLYVVASGPHCGGTWSTPSWLSSAGTRASWCRVALAAGVVCYPFLYAAAPGTGYWIDGRYGIYFPALLVALFATMSLHPRRPVRTGPWRRGAAGADPTERDRCSAVAATSSPRSGSASWRRLPDRGRSPHRRRAGVGVLLLGLAQRRCPHGAGADAMRAHHIEGRLRRLLDGVRPRFLEWRPAVVSPSPCSTSPARAASPPRWPTPSDPAWLFFAPAETELPPRCSATPARPRPLHGANVRGSPDETGNLAIRSCVSVFSTPSCRRTG